MIKSVRRKKKSTGVDSGGLGPFPRSPILIEAFLSLPTVLVTIGYEQDGVEELLQVRAARRCKGRSCGAEREAPSNAELNAELNLFEDFQLERSYCSVKE